MEAVGSEQPAAPAVPSTAAADAAQNATAPPAASAEPAPRSRKEEHAAVLAALLGVPSPDAAARYQALLQLSPAPAAGGDQQQQQQQEAVVRVEYSCVDVSDRYLVCGSNTGVVDMYAHDGRGGNCRLLKALVPPQRSRHTNVKLTCLKLGPQDRMLAVGNILGAVNVIVLDLSAGGANKAQRMVHSHAHHEEAVRCLVWDEDATRLYSGCDGGVIVETRLPLPADVTPSSTPPPDAVTASLGAGVGSALSLLGSAPLGLGLGSTLASLFQGCSSAVWQREESEIIQLSFHSLAGGKRLPPGMQRPGDPTADALLLATHARRCNVHLLNRSHPKSLLYSIQVEGGGSSSSGRTIHGAAVILGTHPTNHQQQQQVDYIHLYISRPQGKFWLLDLGTPDQPVKTLTPTLLPRPLSLDSETVPPPSLGGRLFPLPPLRREGDGRRRRWMLSWTPLGALYVLAMEAGGDDVDEGEEEEREDDGSRAVCLWSRGLHSLALLAGGDVGQSAAARLVLLHDPDKAIGMLELGPHSSDTYGPAVEKGVKALQRAWREKRATALHGELQDLLDAIRGASQRSREQYRQAMRAAARGGHTATVLQAPEEEKEEEEEDPATAAMLAEVDAACARARAFVASVAPAALPAPGAGPELVAAAPGGEGGAGGGGEMDGAAGALVDMVEALLAESRRLVGGEGGRGWEPATATAAAAAGGAAEGSAVPAAGEQQEDEQGRQSQSNVKRQRRPVLYRGLARRHGGPAVRGQTEKRRLPLATPTAPAIPMDVALLPADDGGVRSAISALAQLQYDVTLVASAGLGLDLAFVGPSVVVRGLAFLPDGRPSPAQLCGRIRPGDVLLAVNDVPLEPLGLKDKLGVLLTLGGQRDAEISLRFMAKEASSALGRTLLPASSPAAAYYAGFEGEEEKGVVAARGSNPFLPPPSLSAVGPSSSFQSLDEEELEGEEEENEDDSGEETGAVLGMTEPQRQAMQEKMVELGLLKPSNVPSSLSSSASMVQQLLSTIVGGGRAPGVQRGPSAPEGSASGSEGKRRWGEAGGLGDGVGLGLAQPPEAMERELQGIARDVRILWAAQQRAAGRSSRFCDGGTEAVSPLQLAEEGREVEEEGTRLRRLAVAWVRGQRQRGKAKGVKGRKGRKQQSQQQQRDIAQEYLGLLYFKDLLKRSLAETEATQPTHLGAPAGAKEAAGVGAPIIQRRRRFSREWGQEEQEEENGGTSDEEREELKEGESTLVPLTSLQARAAPLQVYLEAVPLSDVLAELGGGTEEEEEEGEAREEDGEEEEEGGRKRRAGWMGPVVEEEDAQDLERALQVLSRALEATLDVALQEAAPGADDGGGGGGRPWPPIQATHVTGMAVAVQQAHAILGSSEALLQEWLRCFDPLPPERRGVLQESSSAFLGAHLMGMDREDAAAIAQHHRLTCELVTLFFQMHTVWGLLEKPPTSAFVSGSGESAPSAAAAATAGTEEVRLRIAWGRRPLNTGDRAGGEEKEDEDGEDGCLDPATGIQRPPRGREEGRPSQWAEGEAMAFLEEYGAYVVLDGIAQACMARGFARVLRWVTQELAPAEGRFRAMDAALGEALEAVAGDFSEGAAAALVRQVAGIGAEDEGEGEERAEDKPLSRAANACSGDNDDDCIPGIDTTLCLALRLLQRAVALPAAAAPAAISVARRLCAALFPHLRPWAVRDLLAASGQAEEFHDALLAAVDAAWAKRLAAAMKEGAAASKSRSGTALPLPALLPSLGLRMAAPRFVLDAKGEEENEEGGVPVPVLQRALLRRIAHLRRGVAAADVLTAAHSHIWEQAALVEAGLGGIDGRGRGGSSLPRRPQVLPPLLQSVAMLEAAADVGQEVAGGEEEEEVGVEMGVKEAVGDPVEGPGGLGVPLEAARLWEEGLRCGACFLPCYDHSGGSSGSGTADGQMGDATTVDATALVLFACQHAFHARCLPEKACTLCLRENFAPF